MKMIVFLLLVVLVSSCRKPDTSEADAFKKERDALLIKISDRPRLDIPHLLAVKHSVPDSLASNVCSLLPSWDERSNHFWTECFLATSRTQLRTLEARLSPLSIADVIRRLHAESGVPSNVVAALILDAWNYRDSMREEAETRDLLKKVLQ